MNIYYCKNELNDIKLFYNLYRESFKGDNIMIRRMLALLTILLPILLFVGCPTTPGDSGTVDYTKTWSISGTIDFSGCISSGGPDVKFAAFFIDADVTVGSGDPVISNIINLGNGTSQVTGISFTLNIDASGLTDLAFNDTILLACWSDQIDNDIFDDTWVFGAQPNSGCPVFDQAYDCRIVFFDNELFGREIGWNIEQGNSTYLHISDSNKNLTNANLNDEGLGW
jgi:hypothetical protein